MNDTAHLLDIDKLVEPLGGEEILLDANESTDLADIVRLSQPWSDKDPNPPIDWMQIWARSLRAATKSRDIRLAFWLMRSGSRLHGIAGLLASMLLMHRLLTDCWDTAHPRHTAGGKSARLTELAKLNKGREAVERDLYDALIAPGKSALTLGSFFGELDQAVIAEQVKQLRTSARAATAVAIKQLRALASVAEALQATLVDRLGLDAPRLILIAQPAIVAADLLDGESAGSEKISTNPRTMTVQSGKNEQGLSGAHSVSSRADVVRELKRLADWLEHAEPANPASLYIRRAQRLVDMSFEDIIKELAPDSLRKVQESAGVRDQID